MKKCMLAVAFCFLIRLGSPYDITNDTTWSGNHIATESVTVKNGATLRIDAGTTVQLPTNAYIRVENSGSAPGRILAEGTQARPILFTRIGHHGGSGRWGKIRLSDSTRNNRLLYCQFFYGNGTASTQQGHGVISPKGSNLLLQDCSFYFFLGDATYIGEQGDPSSVTLRRCYFSVGGDERPNTGGEQGVTGYWSHIEEDSCVFAYREGRFDASDIEGVGYNVRVHDCLFLGSNLDDGCDFDNSDGVVENCIFYNYLGTAPGWDTRCGGVTMNDSGGIRIVRNNIFINCRQGIISKGQTTPYITNCTFFNCFNDISAFEFGEIADHQVGQPTVRNCIMWGTTSQTLVVGDDSGGKYKSFIDIDYCLVSSTPTLHRGDPRVKAGSHIFKANPLFANPATTITANPDFHLRSKAGRWDPRANSGIGAWVVDTVHSPAIDAGDPASTYSLYTMEPAPNGNRLNIGAYGGMAQASKSIPLYSVQVVITPTTGGTVTKTPPGPTYFYRDTVRLRAIPALGYRFDRWQGAATGTTDTVSVVTDGNKSVTAVFAYTPPTYTLQIQVSPTTGGLVTKTPNRATYYDRETVQLLAVPKAGYRFDRWQGAVTGTANPVSATMNGSKSATAFFVPLRTAASNWRLY